MFLLKRNSQSLIDRSRRGDPKALHTLYSGYCDSVYSTCLRLVGQVAVAEELTQDVFLAAFGSLAKLRSEEAFGGWVRRIAVNLSLNHLRRRPEPLLFRDELPEVLPEDESLDDWSQISTTKLSEAIASLPEKARVVFSLYQLEGLRHREIADTLGISESTSKSQYQRALMLLRQKLIPAHSAASSQQTVAP